MPPTLSAPRVKVSRSTHRRNGRRAQRARSVARQPNVLGSYADVRGREREVLAYPGAAESVLVVDRDALTRGDRRLVAHLAADEPAGNAALVCDHYLRDVPGARGRCRRLTIDDARVAPPVGCAQAELDDELAHSEAVPVDRLGNRYLLELMHSRMSIPELRWRRHPSLGGLERPEPVSVRDAIASIESYAPVCALTRWALRRHDDDAKVSTALLRAELSRLQQSPIVLNRRLREVVLVTVENRQLSMSEIAARCGRVKRDCRGNQSGETSWLARRVGLLPEAGRGRPTPWIHSDVLALIARRGLGIAPHEVELS